MIFATLFVWIGSTLPVWSATRNVLLLFDERPSLPGLSALDAEFVRALASNHSADRIEIYREAMDLSRFGSGNYQTFLRDVLLKKYEGKKIDVAVAIVGPALDFLLHFGEAIFPGASIVFCAVDRRELGDKVIPSGIYGILGRRQFAPTVELALGLHPETKHAVVVAGTSDFDNLILDQARPEFRSFENKLDFTYLTTWSLQKLLVELTRLPPKTIVLFTTLFQDGAGESFVPHEVVQDISASSNVPMYGFLDQYLGRGIVGGSLYSFSAHGSEAAKLVLQLLAGQQPGSPLLELQANKVQFDWRQMQRWGISEWSLPAGSEIKFRDPTAWQQYRVQIIIATGIIALQTLMIAWLIYEHRRRQVAEVTARGAMSDLMQMNRIATAGEISGSIAHEVNQPLTSISANAGAALNWLRSKTPDLNEIRSALTMINDESHRAAGIVQNLRAMFRKDVQESADVDINKVILAVLELMRLELQKHRIAVRTELDDRLPVVLGRKVQLQQVVFNLVMNAKEAMQMVSGFRELHIKSELNDAGRVQVSIEDSGTGISSPGIERVFSPAFTTKASGMGMGLSICRTIIESHGGKIWVTQGKTVGAIFGFALPPS
jgi:signal transduction histidine kinase